MSAQYAEKLVVALREARGFLEEDFPTLKKDGTIGRLFRDRDSSGLERQAERLAGGCAVDGVLFNLGNVQRDVEAFDGEAIIAARAAADAKRRADYDASIAAKNAAMAAVRAEMRANNAAWDAAGEQLRGVNYALAATTLEEALALPNRGREYFDGLRADATRLEAECAAHAARARELDRKLAALPR